jgi:hypothetical protein
VGARVGTVVVRAGVGSTVGLGVVGDSEGRHVGAIEGSTVGRLVMGLPVGHSVEGKLVGS